MWYMEMRKSCSEGATTNSFNFNFNFFQKFKHLPTYVSAHLAYQIRTQSQKPKNRYRIWLPTPPAPSSRTIKSSRTRKRRRKRQRKGAALSKKFSLSKARLAYFPFNAQIHNVLTNYAISVHIRRNRRTVHRAELRYYRHRVP